MCHSATQSAQSAALGVPWGEQPAAAPLPALRRAAGAPPAVQRGDARAEGGVCGERRPGRPGRDGGRRGRQDLPPPRRPGGDAQRAHQHPRLRQGSLCRRRMPPSFAASFAAITMVGNNPPSPQE
eukprot:gene3130-biopygen3973